MPTAAKRKLIVAAIIEVFRKPKSSISTSALKIVPAMAPITLAR
jgi:hypothetical protein